MKRTWFLLVLMAALVAIGFTAQDSLAQGAVSGVVLDTEGNPVENARVVIHSAVRVRGERPFHAEFATGENGVFGWREVPAGRYIIQAAARGAGAVRDQIGVRDGEVTRVQLQFVDREREREEVETGTVGGQVVDTDGNPIPGAVVTVTFRQENRRGVRQRGLRTQTDRNGVFTFERVPAGMVGVTAAARGYNRGAERVEVIADQGVRVRFELQARERGGRGGGE